MKYKKSHELAQKAVSKAKGYSNKLHKKYALNQDGYSVNIGAEGTQGVKKSSGSSDMSKAYQKSRMKKEIQKNAANQAEKEAANSFGNLSQKFVDKAEDIAGKIAEFVEEHLDKVVLVLVFVLIIAFLASNLSSCAAMVGGVQNATIATSYTAADEDILAVEQDYKDLESDLQDTIDNIESDYPDYDEYQYSLAEINHNPYQLAAVLTVLYEDYKEDEVQDMLQTIFELQYELTIEEVVETRTRTETRTGTRDKVLDDGSIVQETYTYTVEVEYQYYILKVILTNNTMDNAVMNLGLTDDQMKRYEILLETYGNRKYLFEDDPYSVLDPGDYEDYDIPAEALTDTQFANMIREAEKYFGMEYVWGGSSPSTGFDCSGYVSWVINHCGNGWNVGRQTANGLLSCCTKVSSGEAKPGDLIFFQGTYDTSGASHVGIYVGNGMMIHCGNPIQYTSINTSYWRAHFLCYGRLD